MNIYDISIPITTVMPVWPGDPPVDLVQVSAIAKGDSANVTRLSMSVHTGTHIDAPKHFFEEGISVDQIPLTKMIGPVLVIEIDPQVNVISEQILKSHPNHALLNEAKKVLFRTRNSNLWSQFPDSFHQNYVGIDASGARYLRDFHLDLIGIDYLSVAPFDETERPHQVLLSDGCILLEGLDLSGVPGGVYEIICLPLNIPACEGAPARVILVDHR